MSRKYLIRITELERLLSEQAEALRQRDLQLSLVEETEAFLRSALARAEEKIEEEEREIEYLRAQIEKLRRMLWKSIVTVGVRMIRRFPASCDSHVIVVRYRHIFRVKYTAWSLKKVIARSVAVSWIIRVSQC